MTCRGTPQPHGTPTSSASSCCWPASSCGGKAVSAQGRLSERRRLLTLRCRLLRSSVSTDQSGRKSGEGGHSPQGSLGRSPGDGHEPLPCATPHSPRRTAVAPRGRHLRPRTGWRPSPRAPPARRAHRRRAWTRSCSGSPDGSRAPPPPWSRRCSRIRPMRSARRRAPPTSAPLARRRPPRRARRCHAAPLAC
jgi:hypothetical protein